ncbi:transcriptional regulator GcvA [Undibacterium jejuense]|uniref:Transcriptional regulator GcvA n=1 Tax=Undibacterium jejuense TaxID=1344949 RepID=A0A923HQ63_9BURK|nr:transcriptional regulator GcvA [Undibacterium jejuense]MBC3863676.1 transcriptional regulator GcvA [Undibacterium jejuense]
MSKRLPPLNSLKVFDVAAKCLSFTVAAKELHVTSAAVSHQIKKLQDHLGVALFQRSGNALLLTEAGERYLPHIREGFRIFQLATDTLLTRTHVLLKVGVPPSLGAKWLMPRLYRFLNEHPYIMVEIFSEIDSNYLNCDISIDYQRDQFEGLIMEPLMSTELFPVCSPELGKQLSDPNDLTKLSLLHEVTTWESSDYPSWEAWFSALEIKNVNSFSGPKFTLAILALQAAIDGHGVALAQKILAERDITAGKLVRPFQIETSLRLHYYLIYAQSSRQNHAFEIFYKWLRNEAQFS